MVYFEYTRVLTNEHPTTLVHDRLEPESLIQREPQSRREDAQSLRAIKVFSGRVCSRSSVEVVFRCRVGHFQCPSLFLESRKLSFLACERAFRVVNSFGERKARGIEVVHVRNVIFRGGEGRRSSGGYARCFKNLGEF